MKKDTYGCACCSPEFGNIFQENKKVLELSALKPASVALDRSQGIYADKIHRRTFLKGSIVVTGTALLVPGLAACSTESSEETTVFTGGTILTVDKQFTQAEALAVRG